MPLTLTLDAHGEELVEAQLRTGRYHSAEEVITRALEALAEKEPAEKSEGPKTPEEAVADILELRKGVTLGGLKIKDLIHEGHKY
jgi:Arc/MetJ-type ribon-helix-helix transcriptional regulator